MNTQIEPRDDVELYQWISEVLGYNVPTASPTPGLQSPFEALADIFFGRTHRCVLMAARGSGKSTLLAILALLLGHFRPGITILLFSAVEKQAGVTHSYLRRMLKTPGLREAVEESLQIRVTWHNGSRVIVSSAGADSSVVSLHGHVVLIDEGDTWDRKRYEDALLCASGDDVHPGSIIIASTRYSDTGLLNKLLGQGAFDSYCWDFWSQLGQCQECLKQDCPLFIVNNKPYCRGRGLAARGFTPLESILNSFAATSSTTWAVQQCLEEPNVRGRLFRAFSDKHIGKAPTESGGKVVGLDWGLTPAIVLLAQVDSVYWVIEEYGGRGMQLNDLLAVVQDISSRHGEVPIFCGSHDQLTKPTGAAWAEHGITVIPVTGTMNFREHRHDEIRRLLETDRLLFSENCPRTAQQIKTARIQDERGPRQADDFRDALSYAVAGVYLSGGSCGLPGGGFIV